MNVILITGASSGIGRELAFCYAKQDVTLYLIARNKERLSYTAQKCRDMGATVFEGLIDVTDKIKMNNYLADKEIDLVIANAGISAGTGLGDGESETQINQIFKTNIDGVLNTISPLIPKMQKRKSGQIAIISSLAAYRGLPSAPSYSASKAAVKIYGEALRGHLHKWNIGVTVVTPGYIKTPMTDVNNFYMPFLMEADVAANKIKNKLSKNPARIAFPWVLYFIVNLLSFLPTRLTDIIFRNLPNKPNF